MHATYLTSFLTLALLLFSCSTAEPVNAPTMSTTTPLSTLPPAVVASAGPEADVDRIADRIRALFRATDARDWATVATLFADSVQMDYSALGAEAQVQTPTEIVTGWQAMLPGFERTVHNPHQLAIWVTGDRATATYDALAVHFLDGEQWTVFAGYDAEFVRANGTWKIARTRLSLYEQTGNEELPARAMARVEAGELVAPATERPNAETVRTFFARLEEGDLDGFIELFAEDGTQLMPLAPTGFPTELRGKEALRKQYGPVTGFASQSYPVEVIPTQDPNLVLAKYRGAITVEPGKEYNNSYVGMWAFDAAGKIATFTEFFNPNILQNGFPGQAPAHYSVHEAAATPASGVRMQTVQFDSEGDRLVGHLFLPPNFDDSRQYPAVVVTGSWTSVKEQMPDEYASLLAKDGFVTLTFDFRGWGESGGSPRQYESYERKITDIRNAATYLLAHPNTSEELAGLGVCASSGYMVHAVAQDDRFRKLTLIAPWLHTPGMTYALYDSRPDGGRDGLLERGRLAREAFEADGTVTYDQAVSELNPLAAMYVPGGAFPYYLNPALGAGPYYANRWAVMSWEPWLTFDAVSAAGGIDVPVHIVHSEQGAVPQGAKDFIAELPGKPEVVWLNDYNQSQLYCMPEAVHAALGRTAAWLGGQ